MPNSHMTFGVDLLPRTTNTYNLGNSSQKWNVWVNQINGTTPVTSVNTQTGDVVLTASDLGAYTKPNSGIPDTDIASAATWNAKQEQMVVLSYGSSTWNDFITAYNNNAVVYCRASSNSNPASGSQTRMAFMAYVNNGATPTEVEFQYYRSRNSHTASQLNDEVYIYKLAKSNGWTNSVRQASIKQIKAGTNIEVTYNSSDNSVTINNTNSSTPASDTISVSCSIATSDWTQDQTTEQYTYTQSVTDITSGTEIFYSINGNGYYNLGSELTIETGQNEVTFTTSVLPTGTISLNLLLKG